MSTSSGQPTDADVPVELRQQRIAGLVADGGFVRVADLVNRSQVSTVTMELAP